MKYRFLYLILVASSCSSGNYTTSNENEDKSLQNTIYENEIKTVRVHPLLNDPYEELFPAVAELGKTTLQLQFDDLVDGTENYYARLIHCNSDWTKSRLSPLQYIDGYNEFSITDYEFSSGTKIPYVHYTFQIPQVKIPGNYILEVYRNTPDEMVIRHRIMYYQPAVRVYSDDLASGFNAGFGNQRINFIINYTDFEVINPLERINVLIRQNNRWDNSVSNIRPTFIRQEKNEMEYQYFDNENNFSGGNEFRAFDLRSINSAGANIQNIVHRDTTTAVLMVDLPRDYQAYSRDRDLNGAYVISNYDRANDQYGSEYINTIFTLKSGRKFLGEIYLHGALTNWQTSPSNRLKFNENKGVYEGKLLLKQGWYNYQYLLKNDTLPSSFIEGEHFETENSYDILVYYKSLKLNADILIGYERWFVNPQF